MIFVGFEATVYCIRGPSYLRVTDFAGIVETVLLHMLLDVHRTTECSTLGATIWRFMSVNALMGPVAAFVW